MEQILIPPEIEEILGRYLSGEKLSSNQKRKLADWVELDPLNKCAFEELENTLGIVQSTLEQPDTKWQELNRRLRSRRLGRHLLRFSAVASLILLIICGVYVAWLSYPEKKDSLPQVYSCSAGKSPAYITLPDGTNVKLGANSTLVYNGNFNINNRDTRVIGEAFFDVKSDKKLPFTVNNGTSQIKVTGTQFNINARNDTILIVTLLEGSVEYSNSLTKKHTSLYAGTLLRYNKLTGNLSTSPTTLVADDFLGERHAFECSTLRDILARMGELYGLTFVCDDSSKMEQTYRTGFFEDESETEFLEILTELCGVHYKYLNDSVVILSAR